MRVFGLLVLCARLLLLSQASRLQDADSTLDSRELPMDELRRAAVRLVVGPIPAHDANARTRGGFFFHFFFLFSAATRMDVLMNAGSENFHTWTVLLRYVLPYVMLWCGRYGKNMEGNRYRGRKTGEERRGGLCSTTCDPHFPHAGHCQRTPYCCGP
jgi:hypothetical protein